MRKARTLLILGIWVTLIPYLGFPYSWKDILTTLSGLTLIIFSYVLYMDYKTQEGEEEAFDNFRENKNFSEDKNKDVSSMQGEIEIEVIDEEPEEKSYRGEI